MWTFENGKKAKNAYAEKDKITKGEVWNLVTRHEYSFVPSLHVSLIPVYWAT